MERAKAAGEGLPPEEKEKILARQKARLAVEGEKGEDEKGKGKDNAGTDKNAISEDEKARMKAKMKAGELEKATSTKSADASAKDSGGRSPSEEEKARMKRREEKARLAGYSRDTKAAGSAPTASTRVSTGDGGLDRPTLSAATAVQQASGPVVATPPPGLSRSELARWYKRQQQGAGLPMGAIGYVWWGGLHTSRSWLALAVLAMHPGCYRQGPPPPLRPVRRPRALPTRHQNPH